VHLGTVSPSTSDFRLYITPAKTGDLVQLMHAATSREAVADVVGQSQELVKPKNLKPAGCIRHVIQFLSSGHELCSGSSGALSL
jgi:hypothetical protein